MCALGLPHTPQPQVTAVNPYGSAHSGVTNRVRIGGGGDSPSHAGRDAALGVTIPLLVLGAAGGAFFYYRRRRGVGAGVFKGATSSGYSGF
jgi:hypothetical protein